MRHPWRARALAALVVVVTAAACGSDSNEPRPEETTLQGMLAATNGIVGNIEITVTGDLSAPGAASRAALRTHRTSALAVLNLTGEIQLSTGATIPVTGTWDTQTGGVSMSGGGYTFTGAYVNGKLSGTFLGPQVTGVFVMTISSGNAAVATYCGTITGTDAAGDPENGILNLAIDGTDAFGMIVLGDQSYTATGTVTGSTVNLTVTGGSATGTISGSNAGGIYTTTGGSSGTWQASAAGCTGAAGGTVASVTLNPDSYTLLPSDSVLVFATAKDASGNYVANATFTWGATPPGVVSVNPVPGRTDAAWVVGVAAGTATVRATAGGVTGNGTFTVSGPGLIWSDVSVGYNFSCGVAYNQATAADDAYCWGRNDVGNLGDGSTTPQTVPTLVAASPVTGPITDWLTVQAGGGHACGLTRSGKLYCWGSNTDGRLGGGTGDSHVPRLITNPVGVTVWEELAVGNSHSCARTGTAIYCWGYNSYGKLGDNSTTAQPTPTKVADPAAGAVSWVTLAVGESHTCAVAATGDAYCWGYGGNLGDGGTANSSIPVKVVAPVGVTFNTISAGGATCAVSATNVGYCWGKNNFGALGDPAISTGNGALVPNPVAGGLSFLLTAQGLYSSCGLATPGPDGIPYCWGSNFAGQLGNNSQNDSYSPGMVSGGLTFTKIDVISTHACGLTPTGEVWCWGQNLYGEIGIGTSSGTTLELVPKKVP